jgi:hypothetical protein
VETVEYLMVREETTFEQSVGIALVQSFGYGLKLYVFFPLFENISQAIALFGIVGKYVNLVTPVNIFGKAL